MVGQACQWPSVHPKSPLSPLSHAPPAGEHMRFPGHFPQVRPDTRIGRIGQYPHTATDTRSGPHSDLPAVPFALNARVCPEIGWNMPCYARGSFTPLTLASTPEAPFDPLSELPQPSPGVRSAPCVREVRTCPRCADPAIWGPSAADTRIIPFRACWAQSALPDHVSAGTEMWLIHRRSPNLPVCPM